MLTKSHLSVWRKTDLHLSAEEVEVIFKLLSEIGFEPSVEFKEPNIDYLEEQK